MIEAETRIASLTAMPPWMDHWGLSFDPFSGTAPCHVPLAAQEEAIARLTYLIESGLPLGLLIGEAGTGTSTVLDRLCRLLRAPNRRFVPIPGPIREGRLAVGLSTTLGVPEDWNSIRSSFRVQGWQRAHLIIIVDVGQGPLSSVDAADLKRIWNLGVHGAPKPTLIVAAADENRVRDCPELRDGLPARLLPLTRTETVQYLSAKLRAAGRTDEAFTPRALTRIHAASRGIPRRLDRLASICLMAGASQRLEMISPDVVDGTCRELWPDPD